MINDLTDQSQSAQSPSESSPPVSACPGLFYNTPALDGTLLRIRVPGGRLNTTQLQALADLTEQFGDNQVYVTNRANLQIRSPLNSLPSAILQRLQRLSLAAANPDLDPLRNVMISPTTGLDPTELYDVWPLVKAWEATLEARPELAALPPKFSVCFDGAGTVSVADRPNDITFMACATTSGTRFRLRLGQAEGQRLDTDLVVLPEQCIPVVNTIATLYLEYLQSGQWREQGQLGQRVKIRRPRLRHMISAQSVERFLQQVCDRTSLSSHSISFDVRQPSDPLAHLGIHSQRQPGLHYVGLVVPLGYVTVEQMRGLVMLVQQYGSGAIRLTPWQNMILPDVPMAQLDALQQGLRNLGLAYSASSYYGTLIACPGSRGCAAAATDTQTDARALIQHLEQTHISGEPIEIHFSGCDKSCAQPRPRGISLVGTRLREKDAEGYDIYTQEPEHSGQGGRFGRLLYTAIPADQVSQVLATMLQNHSFAD